MVVGMSKGPQLEGQGWMLGARDLGAKQKVEASRWRLVVLMLFCLGESHLSFRMQSLVLLRC